MTTTINELVATKAGYYDRTDDAIKADKHYNKHVFIAGRMLQSAEMNEIQSNAQYQLKSIADALFKDGDIVRDCRAVIDDNQQATLEEGAIYIQGQVRGVPAATLKVAAKGSKINNIIGIWLVTDVVTDTDDTSLRDPAIGNRGFQEPGAYRLRQVPQWGLDSDGVQNAEFFPVYYVDDGELRAKEPPPNLDAVTQAIARYDVDSNGSNYVINGMRVAQQLNDQGGAFDANGDQVYIINAGRARVNGFGISQNSARRITLTPNTDLKEMKLEQAATGPAETSGKFSGKQKVTVKHTPVARVSDCQILQRKAGATGNAKAVAMKRTAGDTEATPTDIQFATVSAIKSAIDGTGKTYVADTDYSFSPNGSTITWLKADTQHPTVDSPALGSTYYIEGDAWVPYNVPASDIVDDGFYVQGAINTVGDPLNVKTTIRVDYFFKLPRIDRLVIDENGVYNWIIGIATDGMPVSPPVPANVLSLCQVVQAWTSNPADTQIINDGVRMVSMSELETMNSRLDNLTDMIAQVNLVSDINIRDAGIKNGLFVDPFVNNDQRDMGQSQTLAIAGGCLQLPIVGTPLEPIPTNGANGVVEVMSCDREPDEVVLSNTAYTTAMKVNPYQAFGVFPGNVTITPAIDRWVDTKTTWAAPETRYFTTTVYAPWSTQWGMHLTQNYTTGQVTTNELASTSTAESEYLRQTTISFVITGWLPNEHLTQVMFDGLDITSLITAN